MITNNHGILVQEKIWKEPGMLRLNGQALTKKVASDNLEKEYPEVLGPINQHNNRKNINTDTLNKKIIT